MIELKLNDKIFCKFKSENYRITHQCLIYFINDVRIYLQDIDTNEIFNVRLTNNLIEKIHKQTFFIDNK